MTKIVRDTSTGALPPVLSEMLLRHPHAGELLRPTEVAELLRVDAKTVTRWSKRGQLRCLRLPSGHRRFYAADVAAFLLDVDWGSK